MRNNKKKHYNNEYKPYGWVKDNLKLGLLLFILILVIYGVKKIIEWI